MKRNKTEIVFTKDYATHKKGGSFVCNKNLAHYIVKEEKAAKYKKKATKPA